MHRSLRAKSAPFPSYTPIQAVRARVEAVDLIEESRIEG
jgi:hypothetical protein